jgi:putative oxidoreductase
VAGRDFLIHLREQASDGSRLVNLALLVLRLVVGAVFVAHGSQKLFGSFGGPGIDTFASVLHRMGMRPARLHAIASGTAEFAGGVLIALGLLTPAAAALIVAVMIIAVLKIHLSKGFFVTNGGFEFNLVLVAAAFALAGVGAGNWLLDHALGFHDAGAAWALGALAVGILGALAALASGRLSSQHGAEPVRPGTA